MGDPEYTPQHHLLGQIAAWLVCGLGLLYAAATVLGLLSLESPQDPIGDPVFTLMEVLTLLIAPLMVVSMGAVHVYAAPGLKVYSRIALTFMTLMAGITSGVHFVILAVSRSIEGAGLTTAGLLFSFRWPSVAYALDILAWDWFFGLAMLWVTPVFTGGRLERMVRVLMGVSGILSLAGLVGVPLGNMKVRLIGVLGYGVVAPVAFLLLGRVLGMKASVDPPKHLR